MAEWDGLGGIGGCCRISAAVLILAAGLLGAGPAQAGEVLVDFEEVGGAAWFPNDGAIEPYASRDVTLTGGEVLTAVDNLVANQTSV